MSHPTALPLDVVDAIVDAIHTLRTVVADELRTTTTADLYEASARMVALCDQVPPADRDRILGTRTLQEVGR